MKTATGLILALFLVVELSASYDRYTTMDSLDLTMLSLDEPVSGPGLGSEEILFVTMQNLSNITVSDFALGYQVNDGIQYLEVVNSDLEPGETFSYSFTEPVDMSEIGDYEIKIFTSILDDVDNSNDTLCVTVTHFIGTDAAMLNASGPTGRLCEEEATVTADLVNRGDFTLTSAIIDVTVNGSVFETINWSGSLSTDESEEIEAFVTGLVEGVNTVEITVSMPNGIADENMSNDSDEVEIEILTDRVFVDLNITLDENPDELTWVVREGGLTIHEGGPYPGQANQVVVEELCLQEGECYTLIVGDTGGDGICCDNGEGMITITDEIGNLLFASDGQYGASLTGDFCEEFMCTLSATWESTKETSDGAMNGTITIFAEDPIGSLEYSIDDGDSFQDSEFFDGLSAGDYDVVVRDQAGCEVEFIATVDSCSLDFTYEVVWASSSTSSDGEIIITAFGGNMPYEYSINGGNTFRPFSHFFNVSGGTYSVVVRDADGCEAIQEVVVPSCGIQMTVDVTNVSEVGAMDGIIEISLNENEDPTEYSIDGGLNWQSSPLFENLSVGEYEVRVRDVNDCEAEQTVEITACELDFEISFSPVTEFGESDGEIVFHATGGLPPYEYSIDGGASFQSDSVFSNLPEGSYALVVRDSDDCSKSIGFFLFVCDLSIDDIILTETSTNNSSDGTATIIVSGGGPPFEYSIDGGANFQESNFFDSLGTGFYVLIVIDQFGCEQTETFNIDDCILDFESQSRRASSEDEADGSIEIFAGNGVEPYEYSIDSGMTFQSSSLFEDLLPGDYEVIVRDASGCERFAIVTVDFCDVMLDFELGETSGPGASDGSINIIASNGIAPYSYSIDGGANFQSDPLFENLDSGPYFIIVWDRDSCRASANVTVPECNFDVSVDSSPESDEGEMDGTLTFTATGGVEPYLYTIDFAANFQSDPNFDSLSSAIYTWFVEDAAGCLVSGTAEVNLCELSFGVSTERSSGEGESDGSMSIQPMDGMAPYQYSVDSGMTFQEDSIFSNLQGGAYTVVVLDAQGCRASATVVIEECDLDFDLTFTLATNLATPDGGISVHATGGIPPYTYSLGGEVFQDDSLFMNLLPRNYFVVVRDASGCQVTRRVLLGHCYFEFITNTTPASRSGASDGSITVEVDFGGRPPFEYSIDSGTTFQDSGRFENLSIGLYDIMVRDSAGCIQVSEEQVEVPLSSFDLRAEHLAVRPNPTQDMINVKLPALVSSNKYIIELINIDGRILRLQETARQNDLLTIDLSEQDAGVYQLLISTQKQRWMTRVIKF